MQTKPFEQEVTRGAIYLKLGSMPALQRSVEFVERYECEVH